jgi:erythromycin esterase-like protein
VPSHNVPDVVPVRHGALPLRGDWPDCYRLNRCVTLRPGAPGSPREVLDGFERWPTWMWANEEVVAFAEWLRAVNAGRPEQDRVGFYGLDVYSLWDSMRALIDYLREHEPEHVEQALRAYRCFEPYREDPQRYAMATRFSPTSCEAEVVALLTRLCRDRTAAVDGEDPEARFVAEQNAAVAADAERYYRAMAGGDEQSWNVRDTHMADTLDRLLAHRGRKGVVWEHNTHVGDARATDMARQGLVNLGQLARERHGPDAVVLVGAGSHRGSVVAAEGWGEPMRRMAVPPARPGSVEHLVHRAVGADCLFVFAPAAGERPRWLAEPLTHRAIGVVYHPEAERWGNYVPTRLADRYDAFLYVDRTAALQPLHLEPLGPAEAQTFPTGV